MPKTLGSTSPLYEIPFDDNTLIIVGRIALMWGQIVFHLDAILKQLKGMTDEQAATYEPRSLKSKLADLTTELSKPANAKHRSVLRKVHQSIDQVASDRNVAFHGLWGRYWEIGAPGWQNAARSHSRKKPFLATDLKDLHERMISAAEALDDAWYALGIATGPQPKNRNRQQLWIPKGMSPHQLQPPRIVR